MHKLSQQELATNAITQEHIHQVSKNISLFISELLERANNHDASKLEEPEVKTFSEHTQKLAALTYGSQEYQQCLSEMDEALMHHYSKNRHHPEHFRNGINDMNLIDLIELFCDWWAATKRHNDGNLNKSIELNANRFEISPQLVKILENTVKYIGI
jgi:hypothetical protein